MGIAPTEAGAAPLGGPAGPSQQFAYDGRLGELFGIFFVNLLLSIVTLGFYRFWAKTRMRRYIWSRVSLNGDAFEYTGTGGELFIGFLIVVGIFFVATVVKSVIDLAAPPDSPLPVVAGLLFALAIVYLIFVARYAAQRYRLTRTLWRGIRGGMTGSAWAWGFKAMFLGVLAAITLGLAGPWVQMRLLDDRLNNSYFGDAKASIHSSSVPLYVAFLIGIAITWVGMIAIIAIAAAIAASSGFLSELMSLAGAGADNEEARQRMDALFKEHAGLLIGLGIFFYLSLIVLSLVAFAQYYVAMAREVFGKLSMAELRFGTTITIGRIISLMLGNVLIFLFTLGLGLPIVIHRSVRFLTDNIQVYGEIEGSEITHADLPRPRYGEGLLEAFDPGLI
jgi:uncharacterized membrane protein YjgN (DUF898 family)